MLIGRPVSRWAWSMGVVGSYSQCMEESLYTVNCSNGMAHSTALVCVVCIIAICDN